MITVFICQARLKAEVSRYVNSTYSAWGRGPPSHLIRSQAEKLVWTTATGIISCIVMHQHSVVPKNFWNHEIWVKQVSRTNKKWDNGSTEVPIPVLLFKKTVRPSAPDASRNH